MMNCPKQLELDCEQTRASLKQALLVEKNLWLSHFIAHIVINTPL